MISRERALEEVQEERFDVAVIGGGITGAGVALDAASRGYTVALLERDDWAVGTSSRSSKMVHGGLRYLRNFDLGLVREALLERQLMVELAPHLVYPTPYLVPTLGDERRDRKIGIGLNMYDVMAQGRGRGRGLRRPRQPAEAGGGAEAPDASWSPDRHRTISGEQAIELVPALAPRDPSHAYLFYDCQTDDSRLVLTIIGEAERFGAVALNRAEVLALVERDGLARGVECRDRESGETFVVEADNVVNATGVWADTIRPEEIHDEAEVPSISPSRGTHVTVSQDDLPIGAAACIVPAGEGRTIFALPWYGRTLIGTTDRDYEGDIARVAPSAEDVEYLLAATNEFFGIDLDESDLTGAFAGVRPLIATGDPRKSVDISRKEELYETSSGLLTITGGKLTTWRRMAQQTVDRLVEREGRAAPCRTAEIPLGMPASAAELEPPAELGAGEPPDGWREQLAFRYGHSAERVLRLAASDRGLWDPIVPGRPDLMAEVVFAARHEQARSISDALLRRTRLGILAAPRLREEPVLERIAGAMGGELGWGRRRRAQEIERWREEALAEGIDPAGSVKSQA